MLRQTDARRHSHQQTPHAPIGMRAYYIDPLLIATPQRWTEVLADCASMGFDTVVIAPPNESALAYDRFLILDYARPHPQLGWADDTTAALADLARVCKAHGLALVLDIALDRCAAANPDVAEHPQLYTLCTPPDVQPPDPRTPSATLLAAAARFGDADAADELKGIWQWRMNAWLEAGVAGFRCLFPQRVPARIWRDLIVSARRRVGTAFFAAWTPGLPVSDVAALKDCGFNLVYSSLPWWDFSADWWLEEDERLRRVSAVSAPLEDPLGERLAYHCVDTEHYRRVATRLLDFSAAFEDGILITMGFESLTPDSFGLVVGGTTQARTVSDLRAAIVRANTVLACRSSGTSRQVRDLLGTDAPLCAWLLEMFEPSAGEHPRLLLVNRDLEHIIVSNAEMLLKNCGGYTRYTPLLPATGEAIVPGTLITLEPGEVRVLTAEAGEPILAPTRSEDTPDLAVARTARIVLENPAPCVDGGRFAVKRTVGESVNVEIDAFSDGHDALAVELLWKPADARNWSRVRMRALDNDRWAAEFPLQRLGRHVFTVHAWRDAFATLRSDIEKKLSADALNTADVDEAYRIVADAAKRSRGAIAGALSRWEQQLAEGGQAQRVTGLLSAELSALMAKADPKDFLTEYPSLIPVDAEPLLAHFASWYELFPRSQGDSSGRHGTFNDVIARLPAIRDMGFDVLYMPPIHPIGATNRKARNNQLVAEPGDPGSPYAIGSPDGGHDTIHLQLGTFEDFGRLCAAARKLGIEIALDFAIQCSPDHPWLRAHPEWFAWRTDGSVRYAENPPKKYQDIVNPDFYAEGALPDLWRALRDIVLFWIDHGVRLFRVDNPHTKPFPFWEWMIEDIRARHPEVVFLAEAFTRPKPMYRLAKLGFSQSYTYFTWRHTKAELTAYFTELAQTAVREYFRPHLFVNTPDINPVFLQNSGRAGFLIRAALATMLSGLWGMYSGFELCESEPIPGREEYLDSEKYEIKMRDWNAPGNIIREIRRLNEIRRMNPALQDHRNLTFYNAFNDQVLYFGKATTGRSNAILVAVNLDPYSVQEADFEVPLWEWGLPDQATMIARDLVLGGRQVWRGKVQHMRLDPALPFAIWRIRPETSA
ncbi:MAG TPA: maltotransferase domain-containing protein [Gammaproteobacteria bacterium]|nr:maltotransferase domain-containing protein [Gammaproteobacteria bacterium]